MEPYVIIRIGNDHGPGKLFWVLNAKRNQSLRQFLPKDQRLGEPISQQDSPDQYRHLRDRKIGSQT